MQYVILTFYLLTSICNGQTMSALIDSSDIVYPTVAYVISKHETGNFKSTLYKKHNNAFGFKGKRYLKYASKKASVLAYQKWEANIIRKYNVKNRDEYLWIISRRYAKNKTQWYNIIKKQIK